MASQNHPFFSPPRASPPLSAVHSSPFASGAFTSLPATPSASPFTLSSSPPFSFTQAAASSPEPDLFEDFTYSDDMAEDFDRIDTQAAAIIGSGANNTGTPGDGEAVQTPSRGVKTWVVFNGRIPGIYDSIEGAITQSQSFPDGFQRAFPNRESAMTAWIAFMSDGTYPGYGKRPWVVYVGRRIGVFVRISDLEGSVSGFAGAIFRSCPSITEAQVRFRLFVARVTKWFAGPDPFPGVRNLIMEIEIEDSDEDYYNDDDNGDEEMEPEPQPATPELAIPTLPLAPQAGVPSNVTSIDDPATSNDVEEPPKSASNDGMMPTSSALDDAADPPKPGSSNEATRSPSHPGEGWYVVYRAVLPGVCYGVEALRRAQPIPGGIECAPDKESADVRFYELSLGGEVVWAKSM